MTIASLRACFAISFVTNINTVEELLQELVKVNTASSNMCARS